MKNRPLKSERARESKSVSVTPRFFRMSATGSDQTARVEVEGWWVQRQPVAGSHRNEAIPRQCWRRTEKHLCTVLREPAEAHRQLDGASVSAAEVTVPAAGAPHGAAGRFRNDCLERRMSGDGIVHDGVATVRAPVCTDLAVGPWLVRHPLHHVIGIGDLVVSDGVFALGFEAAALVDYHEHIAASCEKVGEERRRRAALVIGRSDQDRREGGSTGLRDIHVSRQAHTVPHADPHPVHHHVAILRRRRRIGLPGAGRRGRLRARIRGRTGRPACDGNYARHADPSAQWAANERVASHLAHDERLGWHSR